MKRWTLVAAIVAVGFYVLALSGTVYELTSPSGFSFHVALRKTYSVVAFAIVGFLYAKVVREWRGRVPTLLHTTAAIALYSGLIEVGQHFSGSHESHYSNLFDVACGAAGGALGRIAAGFTEKTS
jgi:hypothetical protein